LFESDGLDVGLNNILYTVGFFYVFFCCRGQQKNQIIGWWKWGKLGAIQVGQPDAVTAGTVSTLISE
jgi:hypothetical protein